MTEEAYNKATEILAKVSIINEQISLLNMIENYPNPYISDGNGHACNIPLEVSTEIFNLVRKEYWKKNQMFIKELKEL